MAVSIPCPACRAVWPMNEELFGRLVKCPGCRYPLPIPNPPDRPFREISLQFDVQWAFLGTIGFGIAVILGIYILVNLPGPVGIVAGLVVIGGGLTGAFVIGRRLLHQGPAIELTADGIIHGSASNRQLIRWAAIAGVQFITVRGDNSSMPSETLYVRVASESEPSTTTINLSGLNEKAEEVAHWVMQRVLASCPHALLEVKETSSETGGDLGHLRV